MKKILLSAFVLVFIVSGYAQNRAIAPKVLREKAATWIRPTTETMNFKNQAAVTTAPGVYKTLLEEEHVGTTWYDLQSNTSMQNRVYKYDDGTIGVTYTIGFNHTTSFDDRGTGYNYFDGNNWGPIPTEKIETDRTGWPSYAPFGENGEIVVSHYAGAAVEGLAFSWREEKGTGDWQHFDMTGPSGSPGMAWPRLVTSGVDHSIIHLIALTLPTANGGSVYEGMDGALLYSSSSDGGTTWDPENQLIDLINSDFYTHFNGDTYEIEARDDVVAILAGDSWTDLVLLKSLDGGYSWAKTVIWENPYPMFDPNNPVVTDTFYCADGAHDVAIDLMGKVHVVFGINRAMCADGATLSWFPLVDGLAYWNEDRATFSDDTHALDPYGHPNSELVDDYSLIGWAQDVNNNGVWDILGEVGYYYVGTSSMPTMAIDDQNRIYVVFASVTETFNNGLQDYRHLWGRGSSNGGTWWGQFVDFTSSLIHIFDECVFPSMSPTSDDNVYLAYQVDTEPGLHVRGDEDPASENHINYMEISKPEFLIGIDEHTSPLFDYDVSHVTPNPVNGDAQIRVNIRSKTTLSLEITNMMGQVVSTFDAGDVLPGMSTLQISSKELTSGVYFCRVKAGDTIITRKMIVE